MTDSTGSCAHCGVPLKDDEPVAFVHGDLLHAACVPALPILGSRAVPAHQTRQK
jgi:hypothetical protein